MKLQITHTTQYAYASPVTDSVNELRLTPFTNEHQSCYQHGISVEPNAPLFSYEDFFGNRVHAFSVNEPHHKLTIRTQMTIVTNAAMTWPKDGEERMPAEESWRWLSSAETQNEFAEFLLPTAYTGINDEVDAFASTAAGDRVPQEAASDPLLPDVYDWLIGISKRIKHDFVYDPQATDVHTVVSDMIVSKRGVCQDFAHLMIAACRSKGVPARYVSGYHFVGDLQGGSADFEQASHAWVEAYVPGLGWCGFDPTNDELIGERYVKLGHGRDYKDIVPVKGVYRGTSEARLDVKVDVRKVNW
ncbi:transglutaminase-like putative cysteine protease [Paenibacillus phyllosphaerae]|uniref:Transglutaminase-like putative cysteine protease n=1 Tax=Paenibacillus phyllosphaerae TaxID=274593 RepID=A0A7W5ATJ6_9BACL|nr:transglutaminase family protein [Paenibacillus phyllosphaerae]MBB3108347.1 transglutaminase-like putative cysteine protease [Paenibacillus phyllosphaerae]